MTSMGCPDAEPVHDHKPYAGQSRVQASWYYWDGQLHNARVGSEAVLQLTERKSDPEYDSDKGVPYRDMRKRARYLLEDFSDEQCRLIVQRVINAAPLQTCEVIAKLWEQEIETAKREARRRERNSG